MTWSIVARDPSGALGVAVASRFFAVGALCPHVHSGIGAISSQALMNPLYVDDALYLVADGLSPQAALDRVTGADPGRTTRQVHLVDASGRTAAHTGSACIDWCGHEVHEGFSVAGNMLAGAQVIAETVREYRAGSALPFALRLIRAMRAGERAGGDKRGKQAAALLIHTTEEYPSLSLRVDDHEEPLRELERLYEKSLERYQPFVACLAKKDDPAGIFDRTVIEERIARFQSEREKA